MAQWQRLHDTLIELGHRVHLIEPHPDLPDMVFAANGGIVIGDRALVPRFRHPQRAPESECFAEAFAALGIRRICRRATSTRARATSESSVIACSPVPGCDPSRAARRPPSSSSGPRSRSCWSTRGFYHLDTALAVLDERTVAYWPGAFDPAGREILEQLFPDAVVADEDDAAALALNMVSDGSTVIMTPGRERLAAAIAERNFEVLRLPTDELLKAGGGAKCCVLERHPA